MGYSDYREEAGRLLMGANRMLRGLLRKDLHIFYNYTESEEGEHLGNSKVQGYEQIPLFYISTYNSPS
jgi:hypothetical protein